MARRKATRRGRGTCLSPLTYIEVLAAHRTRQQEERKALGEAWAYSCLIFTTEVGRLIHPRNFERTFKGLLGKQGRKRPPTSKTL